MRYKVKRMQFAIVGFADGGRGHEPRKVSGP